MLGEKEFKKTSGVDYHEYRKELEGKKGLTPDNEGGPLHEDDVEEQQILYHPLIGKYVMREWLDAAFKKRRLYGIVRYCWRHVDIEYNDYSMEVTREEQRSLEIEYNVEVAREMIPGWKIEPLDRVTEEIAWACRERYEENHPIQGSSVVPNAAIKWGWIIPNEVDDAGAHVFPPKRRLTVDQKNIVIELEARQSNIPGAGLGVFAKLKPLVPGQQQCCVLKRGEMIDLGVYSP